MFIVCRLNDAGTLVASNNPFIHPTEEEATTEALRLANSTNSSQYVVFGALSIASRPQIPDAVVTKYVPPTVFN